MIIIITGIIAEYNPFHNGHKYHLERARFDTHSDYIVCVMSGNFMQRGTPALIDKWKRTEMALRNNIDLILELPAVYSISSAEHFAFGSISLLNSLNIIDNIYFGSESGDIDILTKIATCLIDEPPEFQKDLKNNLNKGLPFHKSRSNALTKYFNDYEIKNILANSNNILGIEYIKALKKLSSTIVPKTLIRKGNNYNDLNLNSSLSSATAIRDHLKKNDLSGIKSSLPPETYNMLIELINLNYPFIFDEDMFKYIKYKLIFNNHSLSKLPDVSEGLDNAIIKKIYMSTSLNDLIMNSKSKRYTYTRINRILTQSFLHLEQYDLLSLCKMKTPYARILGFNSKGRELLKIMKKKSDIEIITKLSNKNLIPHLQIDILGTKAYSLLNNFINPMDDYLKSPIIM